MWQVHEGPASRRSYQRAVIMPIPYARSGLGGCCRSARSS